MDFQHSPNKPADAANATNTGKALELRRNGLSFRAIAEALGISKTQAHRLVIEALTEVREDNKKAADLLRELELERLDNYLAQLAPGIAKGDCAAIKTALSISERRAKLLGIDAPQRVEHSGALALDTEGLLALLDALPGATGAPSAPSESTDDADDASDDSSAAAEEPLPR